MSLLVVLMLFCAVTGKSQKPNFDTILYGASYYDEHMPYERLEKDVELMEKAGITAVRLGESTWSSWEPREGEFQFAWMERIIDRLHKAGIRVILGTPTYSIPPWLYRKHPEILLTLLGGDKRFYGPRQNMDITHVSLLRGKSHSPSGLPFQEPPGHHLSGIPFAARKLTPIAPLPTRRRFRSGIGGSGQPRVC